MKKILRFLSSKIAQKTIELIPDSFLIRIYYYFPDPGKNVRKMMDNFRVWLTSVINLLVRLTVQFFTVIIGWSFALYFGKYLWFIYVHTEVGRAFLSRAPSKTILVISKTLDQPIVPLVVDICLNLLWVGAAFCVIISFLAIKRFFYDARGVVVKLFFAFALTYLTVYIAEPDKSSYQLKSLILLYIIPAFFLLDFIFDFISQLVPEVTAISRYKNTIRELRETARIRNLD